MTHRCPVKGCSFQVPDNMLMCRPHWFQVPANLKDDVWTWYRRAPRSAGHIAACNAASAAVNRIEAERKKTQPQTGSLFNE